MSVLLTDGNIAKLQALEEASWPKGSIKEHSPDMKQALEWRLPATVLNIGDDIAENLTEDLQVQCLPVPKSNSPKWVYRTLPKVTNFGTFGRIPAWGRKPQRMTYHLCAENTTKNCIVPNLPEDEKDDLLTHGILPPSSSARDKHCVMCPVRRGSPRLLPCCLCYNWCHPGCSYQTHLGRAYLMQSTACRHTERRRHGDKHH